MLPSYNTHINPPGPVLVTAQEKPQKVFTATYNKVSVVHIYFEGLQVLIKNIVFFLGRSIAFVLENRAGLDEMP